MSAFKITKFQDFSDCLFAEHCLAPFTNNDEELIEYTRTLCGEAKNSDDI